MAEVNPRDLPAVRAQICELYDEEWRLVTPDVQGASGAWLRDSELYYVTEPMCQLVEQAAWTLPAIDLDPTDLDAPHCLIWFEREFVHSAAAHHLMQVTALPEGMFVNVFLDRATYRELIRQHDENGGNRLPELPSMEQLDALPPSPFYLVWGHFTPWGTAVAPCTADDDVVPDTTHVSAHIVATMLLMRQPLAGLSIEHAPRPVQRRLTRAGRDPGTVRVITLRSPRGESSGGAHMQREYAHQWIVRGHWRQQPHGPGRGLRRPVWIAPHVKGPDGAPLLGGDKVHLFKR